MLKKKYKTALITGAASGIGYNILKKSIAIKYPAMEENNTLKESLYLVNSRIVLNINRFSIKSL